MLENDDIYPSEEQQRHNERMAELQRLRMAKESIAGGVWTVVGIILAIIVFGVFSH
jgi:flagellar biosynthesis/type III secretory pathway M-ring protein FliF/YscJ